MAETRYRIGGMDCANCAREVEAGVARLDSVEWVRVDFASSKMTLSGSVDYETLKARVEALGKTIEPADSAPPPVGRGGVPGFFDFLLSRLETRLALIGGGLVLGTLLLTLFGLPESIAGLLYTVGMGITLYPIARAGVNTLRINRAFSINLLMAIAAIGAVYIGEYLEAGVVIFLFAIGEALEGYTADRARASIAGLAALRPARAVRLADGREQEVAADALAPGDRALVRPGERIPADGVVEAGAGGVDQAPITGESVPVRCAPGDPVYAGTINGEAALEIRVTRAAADTTLSRIIALVEEAQSARAPSQRLIDRFAHYYTPAVVILAALTAFGPPLLLGAPFHDTPTETGWLYRALTMLVIACPCALVISTPVTIISAIAAAARRGVLIKGGAHLEALGQVRALAFDKTGTLTRGEPAVTAWRSVDCPDGADCDRCDEVLALAAAVERRSAHPLARAVVRAAQAQQIDAGYAPAEAVENLAGHGVRGMVGAHTVTLGSHRLFDDQFPHDPALCALVDAAEADGQTTMLLAEDTRVRGYIALADTARPDSRAAVEALRALGLPSIMLTGDNPGVAAAMGAAVGVDTVRAGLLPAHKVDAVRDLMKQYGAVAMVGDGINDTPALAAASVGIAMGGAGSPQALETADIALMADDLSQLPYALRLARFARRLIGVNIVLSLGLKLVFLALAFGGAASLWLAIVADVGMLLAVTLNGMRPLRFR